MPEWGGNHNGGDVRVANDGTLFVSVGDGGGGSPESNPSDLSLPNGKILRINLDGTIPAGNPNGTTSCRTAWGPPGAATVCGEIWADGLRNPFRLGFDVSRRGRSSGSMTSATPRGKRSTTRSPAPTTGGRVAKGPARTRAAHPAAHRRRIRCCSTTARRGAGWCPAVPSDRLAPGPASTARTCGSISGAASCTSPRRDHGLTADDTGHRAAVHHRPRVLLGGGGYSLFYTTYAGGGQLHRVTGAPPLSWQSLGGGLAMLLPQRVGRRADWTSSPADSTISCGTAATTEPGRRGNRSAAA